MVNEKLPKFLKPFLWSYDFLLLDKERDKKRVITHVLNFGTKKATDWLFGAYSREEIKDAIKHPLAGEWNRKSINYWSLVLDVTPGSLVRNIS